MLMRFSWEFFLIEGYFHTGPKAKTNKHQSDLDFHLNALLSRDPERFKVCHCIWTKMHYYYTDQHQLAWPLFSHSIEFKTPDNSRNAYLLRLVIGLCELCLNIVSYSHHNLNKWSPHGKKKCAVKHLQQVCKLLTVMLSQCYAPLCSHWHPSSSWPDGPKTTFSY